MAVFEWIAEKVPDGMAVRQVYGILLDRQGRVMLRVVREADGVRYSLPGGRPEPFDRDREATCRREVLEEVNTEIETPVYLGYQAADEENGTPVYAQVRMAALIRAIGEKRPDPDNGETYGRLMASPERAAELLHWGPSGFGQVMAAKEAVRRLYGIEYAGAAEEWV